MTIHLKHQVQPHLSALLELYNAVRWTAYTANPDSLKRAIQQSGFLWTAHNETGELIGLIRGLTDDVSILYVQDILVKPDWQHQGIGRALMTAMLERYAHVRQMVLITDDEPQQLAFYKSLGFHNTRELVNVPTNAFYRTTLGKLS